MRTPGRIRRWPVGLLSLALVGWFGQVLAASPDYWFESYRHAVQQIDAGDLEQASRILEPLIRNHPVPVAGVRIPGSPPLDYLPYYQRARILMDLGDVDGAVRNLDASESYGAVKRSRAALADLTELRRRAAARSITRSAGYAPVASAAEPAARR